jgi:TRAP-type C4-dicarboxylate transport system substrate-binding protein
MSNKVLSLKKESSMRKMLILCVIAIFFVFCSVNIFADEVKTKADKEKFDKLTPEQKEKFKECMEKARDTNIKAAMTHDEAAKNAEKVGAILKEVKAIGVVPRKACYREYKDFRKNAILEKLKKEEKEKKDKEKH